MNYHLHQECTVQFTSADRLVLTKTDLVPEHARQALLKHLRANNPTALITTNTEVKEADPLLLNAGLHAARPEIEAQRWVQNFPPSMGLEKDDSALHQHPSDSGHPTVNSFCLVFDRQINWTAFGLWLSMLLNRHGRSILRVKGILNLTGSDYPVAIHGVQHLVHPPVHLSAWPNEDRRSRIVFIVRDIASAAIEQSLNIFLRSLS